MSSLSVSYVRYAADTNFSCEYFQRYQFIMQNVLDVCYERQYNDVAEAVTCWLMNGFLDINCNWELINVLNDT